MFGPRRTKFVEEDTAASGVLIVEHRLLADRAPRIGVYEAGRSASMGSEFLKISARRKTIKI
jgi:hypothetical protein